MELSPSCHLSVPALPSLKEDANPEHLNQVFTWTGLLISLPEKGAFTVKLFMLNDLTEVSLGCSKARSQMPLAAEIALLAATYE